MADAVDRSKKPRVLSFKGYVRQRRPAKDAEGEMAANLLTEARFPTIRSWKAFERFLHSQGSYYEPAHRAARALWDEYARWRKWQRGEYG